MAAEDSHGPRHRELPRPRGILRNQHSPRYSNIHGLSGTQTLQTILAEFQDELHVAKSEQNRLCSTSLDDTLKQFLDLVNSVSESDTDLITLARDEESDTSELAQKSTAELLHRTELLSGRMNQTARKYSDQLSKVKTLDSEVTHFSVSEVARYRADIEETIKNYEQEIQIKSNEIRLADIEHQQTQTQISNLKSSMMDAARRQDRHETARNVGIAGSVLGGVAALGTVGLAILFPPAGIAAAFAVGAGASTAVGASVAAGVAASDQDDNVDTQKARQAQFGRESNAQQIRLKSLEEEKRVKEQALSNGQSALKSVLQVNTQLVDLGTRFRTVRSELFALRSIFSRVQMKLEDMTRGLEMCEFADTRKELAACLNDVLGGLIEEAGLNRNSVTVLQLRNGISGIVSRTDEIQEALFGRTK